MVSRPKEYYQVKLVKKNQSDNSTSLLIWILSVCIAIYYYYCYCCYCYHTWRHGARILVFFFFQFQHHTLLHQQILITRDLSMVMMTMMIFFSLSAAFYTAGFKLNFLFHFKQKKMYESYHHNAMKWWFQMDEYAVRLFDYLWWLNHSKLWISSFYWIPIYYSGAFYFLKCLLFFFP